MPTKTFFNLSYEKKEKILISSKEEFSEYSFHDASINRIIKKAEISRGSFYLYFKNKEDIFVYLLNNYKNKFINKIKEKINLEKHQIDIFELILLMFDSLTSEKLSKNDREFMVKVFAVMDSNLIYHLVNFENIKISNENEECIENHIKMNTLKIINEEDMIVILEMLRSIFVSDIRLVFEGKIEKSDVRKNLVKKIQLLKNGIEK